MKDIRDSIRERILIMDGAQGTVIQSLGLTEADFRGPLALSDEIEYRGNNDMLTLTRPDVVAALHRRYLEAGADMVETCTFSAQRVSQAEYGLAGRARDMALAGARIARREADRYTTAEWPRYVLGSMGPTGRTLSLSPDVEDPAARDIDYATLYAAYREQAAALIEGGVDALLVETVFDTLNAKAALHACRTAMAEAGREVPLMVSVTVSDRAGRTLSGQTVEAFAATVEPYGIFSIGLNCGMGARAMMPHVEALARRSTHYISVYPNAGLPNQLGQYDETPETMAQAMRDYLDRGLVNIVGGCCGTDERHIRRFASLARGRQPHRPQEATGRLTLTGLEPLEVREGLFVNVGERCNVAGSRKFLRLIRDHAYDEALAIARQQVEAGAMVIDINMDDALLDARQEMTHFLRLVASDPEVARVPVMIDSSRWEVVEAALGCCQGRCVVNSISLKEGEEAFLSHARTVSSYGAAVVVMCFDEQGQATTYERRTEIAARAYRLLTGQAGMDPEAIIFDPNILAVATGMEEHDRYAFDFIRATRWIRTHLKGAHVSGGVSNLSFAFRGNNYIREAMHAVFLYHAAQAGMDFAIVNPATRVTYADLPEDQLRVIEDVILCRRPGAAEALVALAASLLTPHSPLLTPHSSLPVGARLREALRRGQADHLADDLAEALAEYPSAVAVIEGPLMDGMAEVGRLFGEGKMFLPQVVKSARTMKQAVALLQPHIDAGGGEAPRHRAGRAVLATVRGDVHDIGKNIVSVVMGCNGFDVVDLGVMVPADRIVSTALQERADLVCLSGLITPSLEEMVAVAREMEAAGLRIPLLIGGATTSEMHVALRIAPVYGGPVAWMRDAAQNSAAAARLLSATERPRYEAELAERYQTLRERYAARQQQLVSIDEARKRPDRG